MTGRVALEDYVDGTLEGARRLGDIKIGCHQGDRAGLA